VKDRVKGIRIIGSGISVYEVEVDLGEYAALTTARLGGFRRKLLRLMPTLAKHECYAGEAGGFVEELDKGTDLAHVMEHVILELLKLASGPRARFSGWTRKRSKHYVIHFQAPSAKAAMRAAVGAIEVIEGIISGNGVDSQALVKEIRNSKDGFRASQCTVRNPKGVSKCK
jgi:cyanophycin synthetase